MFFFFNWLRRKVGRSLNSRLVYENKYSIVNN